MIAVGDEAFVFGAFGGKRGCKRVVDQRAVTVLQAQTAGAALIAHGPFIALGGDDVG